MFETSSVGGFKRMPASTGAIAAWKHKSGVRLFEAVGGSVVLLRCA